MDLLSCAAARRYLWDLFDHKKEVYSTINHNVVVKNVKELSEETKRKLNYLPSHLEHAYDLKEKNILGWNLQDNDLIFKKRLLLNDAYVLTRVITMERNDNYKKINHFVISKEDHLCMEFDSRAEAEAFIKKHVGGVTN